jgi:hypothetical protein
MWEILERKRDYLGDVDVGMKITSKYVSEIQGGPHLTYFDKFQLRDFVDVAMKFRIPKKQTSLTHLNNN